jgi:hypothetical protein
MKLLPLSLALLVASAPVLADDGQRLVRSVSSPPGITEDPEPEGEHAYIKMFNFYVPTQRADGTIEPVEYYNIDDVLVKTEEKAKPLINIFVYGPVIGFDDFSQSGFHGHGRRDAFGAVSLDDGETWKVTNLSNSADKSSFVVSTPLPDPGLPEGSGSVVTPCEEGDTFCVTDATATLLLNTNYRLDVTGFSDYAFQRITIVNGVTGDFVFNIRSKSDGSFTTTQPRQVAADAVPCTVQATVDLDQDGVVDAASNIVAVTDAPENCVGPDEGDVLITDYPGDVTNNFFGMAGNRVLVGWQSKFCSSGFPGYNGGSSADADAVATYLEINREVDLYLEDLFGVAGSQGSTDYREQEEFPGEYDGVGEVPHSCLWSARGVIRENPDLPDTTEMVWFQAERLTSGRRSVNRVEVSCVAGAGCGISWQEDPEGLAPGEGEGPGTGWAGAIASSQTDIWWSFIEWEDFEIIDNNGAIEPLADTALSTLGTGRPQPYVPMMVPVRLTNNARCNVPVTGLEETYCNEGVAGPYLIKDQCVGQIEIPLGPQGNLTPICVVDQNNDNTMNYGDLPNVANTAATRPRLNLQPRDSDGDGVTDDAWVIIIHEEDKGLGRYGFLNDDPWDGNYDDVAVPCGDPDASQDDNCIEADVGKNQFYISYALGTPATSVLDGVAADELDYSLVSNFVAQQSQYNSPEVNWITGTYYPPVSTEDMWDFGELNFTIFNFEIARRAAIMSQPLAKAINSETHLVAMPLFKEGIINQGGPADIMARRVALDDVNANNGTWRVDDNGGTRPVTEQEANPYDFRNMTCEWYDGEGGIVEGEIAFDPDVDPNPYYPNGLCMAPSINLSSRTPHECEASGLSDGVCAGAADMTCVDDDRFGQLCLSTTDPEDNQLLDKALSWYQCPGWDGTDISNGGNTGASTIPAACYTEPDSALLMSNYDDRSWYNPVDISKAHRGFLDGDHVFMLYAWSPNWKQNAVGRDRYELYTRRSFDGGITWTTTPATFEASNEVVYSGVGTTTCETWRDGADSTLDSHICQFYDAGLPEQSRNVTQHKSMLITTLDPRYTPTKASMPYECPVWYQDDTGACLSDWLLFEPIDETTTLDGDPTDVREPSRNFVVFETGDNTTVAVGEAEGLNLDYGRGETFGDNIVVWAETDTDTANIDLCYPNDPHETDDALWAVGTGFCNEFDTMEGFQDSASEEASITSSAYGDFMYGVWGQFNMETVIDPDTGEETHEFVDGDAMFRRIWWIDDYISDTNAWTLPGVNQGG